MAGASGSPPAALRRLMSTAEGSETFVFVSFDSSIDMHEIIPHLLFSGVRSPRRISGHVIGSRWVSFDVSALGLGSCPALWSHHCCWCPTSVWVHIRVYCIAFLITSVSRCNPLCMSAIRFPWGAQRSHAFEYVFDYDISDIDRWLIFILYIYFFLERPLRNVKKKYMKNYNLMIFLIEIWPRWTWINSSSFIKNSVK